MTDDSQANPSRPELPDLRMFKVVLSKQPDTFVYSHAVNVDDGALIFIVLKYHHDMVIQVVTRIFSTGTWVDVEEMPIAATSLKSLN